MNSIGPNALLMGWLDYAAAEHREQFQARPVGPEQSLHLLTDVFNHFFFFFFKAAQPSPGFSLTRLIMCSLPQTVLKG